MIKLLHTADIHLDSPLRSLALRDEELKDRVQAATRTAFTRIVDAALDEEVAGVMIAGDLFDGAVRSASTAAFLIGQIDRLREKEIRVFYIKGNHDAESPLFGAVNLPDNVEVFTERRNKAQLTDNIWIHGVSFSGHHTTESLLPKFSEPVAGSINIGMLHTSLGGAEGHDRYAPCSIDDLKNHGFDYWALGHIHSREVHCENPWIVMPGTPQGRSIREAGGRSATLITINDGIQAVDAIQTSTLEFHVMDISISGLENGDALRDKMKEEMQTIANNMNSNFGIVRLVLSGDSPLRWQILRDKDVWKETAAEMARGTKSLWLDKIESKFLEDKTIQSDSAIDELAGIMVKIQNSPAFAGVYREKVKNLLPVLSRARREELAPNEEAMDALGQHHAKLGVQGVLARLRGGGV